MTDITNLVIDHNAEDGFYAWEDNTLKYATNFVQFPDGTTLQRSEKDTYSYPIKGYYWFNTRQEALNFFQKPDPDVDEYVMDRETLQTLSSEQMISSGIYEWDDYDKVLYEPDGPEPTPELQYDAGNPPAYADDIEMNPSASSLPHA